MSETYTAWAAVPAHLKTKTQLAAMHLRPARNQPPAAEFISYIHGKRRPHTYQLYDRNQAQAKREVTETQKAALKAGSAKALQRRTCQRCGIVKPRGLHKPPYCWQCNEHFEAARIASDLKEYVILDTETTGLSHTSKIVEITIIDHEGAILLNTFVNPEQPIPADATEIHGITDEMVIDAPTFAAIRDQVANILTGKTLVIYNAQYDLGILRSNGLYHEHIQAELNCTWLCAMELYAQFWGDWSRRHESYKWQNLGAAIGQCNIDFPGAAHRALGDCQATLAILQHMAKEAPHD